MTFSQFSSSYGSLGLGFCGLDLGLGFWGKSFQLMGFGAVAWGFLGFLGSGLSI